MNCPRCTQSLPEGSRFCPACGLNLEQVSEESVIEEVTELESELTVEEDADTVDLAGEGIWPNWLQIHGTGTPKKPTLAATLGLFLGPFSYLYLEQMAWFWWGLLAGLCFMVWGIATMAAGHPGLGFIIWGMPVLGFMIHSYDVAKLLNRRFGLRAGTPGGGYPSDDSDSESADPDLAASDTQLESQEEGV